MSFVFFLRLADVTLISVDAFTGLLRFLIIDDAILSNEENTLDGVKQASAMLLVENPARGLLLGQGVADTRLEACKLMDDCVLWIT